MNFERVIQHLCDAGGDFVVIGGWAAIFHGSAHVTNDARAASVEVDVFGRRLWALDLRALIRAKRAAGRPKDLLILPELEGLLEAAQDD